MQFYKCEDSSDVLDKLVLHPDTVRYCKTKQMCGFYSLALEYLHLSVLLQYHFVK